MTLQQFAEIFALLAVQLRLTDADEATIRAYYQALKDLEPELVAMAAHRLARSTDEDGKAWFPKSGEWRRMVAKVQQERVDEQRAVLRKLPVPLCRACSDSGWARIEGDAMARVQPCACRELRRLEVLGRRPMPHLTDGRPPVPHAVNAAALATQIARGKGMR